MCLITFPLFVKLSDKMSWVCSQWHSIKIDEENICDINIQLRVGMRYLDSNHPTLKSV